MYKLTEEFWYNPAFKFIYIFHMPLFMGVSGFVAYGFMGRNTAFETMKKRFLQLIVPIFFWAIIYKSVMVVIAVASNKIDAGSGIMFLPLLVLQATIDGFWFLQCVFFSSVIVALLRLIKLDRAVIFAVLGTAVLFLPDMYVFDQMFRYTFPFFCIGYSLAKWKNNILPLKASAYWVLPSIVVSLICYVVWTKESYVYVTGMDLSGGNLFNVLFRYMSGAVVSAAFLVYTSLIYKYFNPRILSELGKSSMSIYILQSYFFILAESFWPVYENRILLSLTIAPVLAYFFTLFLHYLASGIRIFSLPRKLLLGDFKKRTETPRHAVMNA